MMSQLVAVIIGGDIHRWLFEVVVRGLHGVDRGVFFRLNSGSFFVSGLVW